jgi:hypothetical protein
MFHEMSRLGRLDQLELCKGCSCLGCYCRRLSNWSDTTPAGKGFRGSKNEERMGDMILNV